ncbi:MAG: 23S rRNA (adenine(2503)-C(2))-methyltransferase RlmN [Clostridia bacterium]|nr:23S rRNA (adenine(2503)-C(2))-methyltransferase RlmN [Clostridia bacterium]
MKIDLLSLTLPELESEITALGYPKFRAKQIFEWMYRGANFSEMSNLPLQMRSQLAEKTQINVPIIAKKLVSALDGTVKYLFELADGNYIESVLMRYKYGLTICISSQVGCRMGCKFCASTIDGKVRDLLPSELLGQIIAAAKDSGERISHVVMMGIGEPLDNYDNVIRFLKLVNMPNGLGISYRSISLSTCGVVPKIAALAEEELPITLSISLHSADDRARSEIMPVNNAYGVAELLCACNSYFEKTGRRISFEYTLIEGKNDSKAEAERLASVLKKYMKCPIHVNLIPLNPVAERDFKTVDRANAAKFAETLNRHGVNATVRRTLGPDINASCGQLRRQSTK